MQSPIPPARQHALRLYVLGMIAIFVGAWLMERWSSMLPMALGGSAGLMLSVPLIRDFARGFLRRPPRD